jgi:biotin operon repressor
MTPDSRKIEELRRKLIVSKDQLAGEQLEALVDKASRYCVVDDGGTVHVRDRKLPKGKQVALSLIARFLASMLDQTFSPTLSADDLASFLGCGKAEVVARAKELVDQGLALRSGRGKYQANPVRIDDFFASLEVRKE